jgi:NAD(P)-dependent dehydrogenase (short-subunit alcohol dehydrogenase family)
VLQAPAAGIDAQRKNTKRRKEAAVKIIVVGATGTIGTAVSQALSSRHEVVGVSRSAGDYRADITSKPSIRRLFESLAPFDAVVCAAGQGSFAALASLSDEDFQLSLTSKLMGQVNLVRLGVPYIGNGGSFTLTSGVLASEPTLGSAALSLVNAGLEGFVRAAALEMPPGARINIVSPPWVRETLQALGLDPSPGMPAKSVAAAYVDSVEGTMTGKVIDARTFAA